MGAVDAVRHDASALYNFIDSVVLPCAVKNHYSYTNPSQEFFSFVSSLGSATKLHITGLCNELDLNLLNSDPASFSLRAQELATLRFGWFELHKYIKPAADAHTLESPASLVAALTSSLRALPSYEKVRFAIVHTTDLNYFQLQSNYVRGLAQQVAGIVSGAPAFPEDLAIVGLPYSQSKALFLNTLLAHEMGHFAYEKQNIEGRFSSALATALGKKAITGFSHQDVTRCLRLALNWLEEIYCDLFALRLVGPAFSYAFIEFLALTSRPPSKEFSASHPALAVRLREQTRLLEGSVNPWWPEIALLPSHYTDLLHSTLSIKDAEFTLRSGMATLVEKMALSCFLELLNEPGAAIRDLFGESDDQVKPFSEQRTAVEDYLSFGVVPSRLIINSQPIRPSATTLLNASYGFYLSKLDLLLGRLSKVQSECVECRAYWAERVEMWTSKGIEDVITDGYTLKIPY